MDRLIGHVPDEAAPTSASDVIARYEWPDSKAGDPIADMKAAIERIRKQDGRLTQEQLRERAATRAWAEQIFSALATRQRKEGGS